MALHLLLVASIASIATAFIIHRSQINVSSADRVEVAVYAESRCVISQGFIVGPFKKTMQAKGVADIVNFAYYPFGNAYFVTEKCGGGGGYTSGIRDCFNTMCGPGSQHSSECFKGEIFCQHGKLECELNRLLACGIKEANEIPVKYMDFAVCVEDTWHGAEPFGLIEKCSSSSNFSESSIKNCYTSNESIELIKKAAASTPKHPEVPWVVVNGKPLKNSYYLLSSICDAYKGPLPDGCPKTRKDKRELQRQERALARRHRHQQ